MEVILLWLDELDDLAFVLLSFWERFRRLCLQIGLLASLTLAGCEISVTASGLSPALAGVAGSSVVLWGLGALLFLASRRFRSKLPLVRA